MAVWLSALRAGRPLLAGRFLILISVRGWVDPRAIVRLEGLGQMKKSCVQKIMAGVSRGFVCRYTKGIMKLDVVPLRS
jgi:hypothetical protein